jgi:hypothetical protein
MGREHAVRGSHRRAQAERSDYDDYDIAPCACAHERSM